MGAAYVAPIGPQNLFVINAAAEFGRRRALLTALIVIFFDATLSLSCFFGIGKVMQEYPWLQMAVLFGGSLIVIYIGICLLRSKVTELSEGGSALSIQKTISSAFVVTWFNPQAIIDGTMMLGAFHVTLPASQSFPFIFGVVSASFLWFIGLTLLISAFRNRLNAKILQVINVICGIIIVFYGVKLFWDFITMFSACA